MLAADNLQQGSQTAGEQIRSDQVGHLRSAQIQRPSDNKRYNNRSGIHSQHMLQSEGKYFLFA
ncbi:hypothetical protein D3C81_2194210 [compost metagenome]